MASPERLCRLLAALLAPHLPEPRVRELLDVVHHAVQAPLRPDFRLPTMVQSAQAFVVPQVRKHRLHGADAMALEHGAGFEFQVLEILVKCFVAH